jgi:ATP-dependent Clp protease ATP-binding subunit ClpC
MLDRLTRRRPAGDGGHGLGSFQRFTDRARRTVTLAQEEARGLGHHSVGTEHLLLGLLTEQQGLAWRVLDHLGVSASAARGQVQATIGRGSGTPAGPIPFTPPSKRVLGLARKEANRLRHGYIGTVHLLVGLVGEGDGVAARVLATLGADRARVMAEVTGLLAGRPPRTQARRALLLEGLTGLLDEVEQLQAEVERLQALRCRHGVEPDGGTARTA